ncbi:hypothetical protein ACS0MR_004515 [Escherichia coli]
MVAAFPLLKKKTPDC